MSLAFRLPGRNLLTLNDLSDHDMQELLRLAHALKARRAAGIRGSLLARKHIAMIFEKMSTRTRCAASVAATDEGGTAEYLAAHEIHLGKKESTADTARVLGRMFDGILFRGYSQNTVEQLARQSGIPVWNGLTDQAHPTQTLADLMTIKENFQDEHPLRIVYVGDGRNNVANSLMLGCAKAGHHVAVVSPVELSPERHVVETCRVLALQNGGSVTVEHDPEAGVQGANVIYSDVWVSMGEEARFQERIALLSPYQIDMEMIQRTGNLESGRIIFLHCLPAFHNHDTDVTRECGALEVTDDVFEASFSKVFDQAENRMHTMKALFIATLSSEKEDVE